MAKTSISTEQMVIVYNKGKSNEFNAIDNLNCEIFPREYIILFGPSGCGKSTLLYTMLGGVPPESGHMYVQGEDIYAYTPEEMNTYQQSTIGIVYQAFNLIPSITVLDNVALPMLFMNISARERNERASNLLRRFGIPQRLEDKLPTMMSGGQQQRVAVARALINDPQILLADEPVGNLDSISAIKVMDSFAEINERDRKTLVLVTHDAKYLPYAHRVFYMRDGKMRRIVVNPEKPQVKRTKPGETIVTEIEQLARLYPYAEPIELKVKSVINYVTQNLGFSQLERLEKGVLEVLKGAMEDAMFFDFLKRPMTQGGAGMHEDDARLMTQKIFGLMRFSKDVERYREEVHQDSMFLHQQKFVDRLMTYLSLEAGLQISPRQKKLLQIAVTERVGGIIGADDFSERLILPENLGGGAFSEDMVQPLSRLLEKLIAQGGYIIKANELEGAHS